MLETLVNIEGESQRQGASDGGGRIVVIVVGSVVEEVVHGGCECQSAIEVVANC